MTNQMGQSGDFEKGEANGATASLALIRAVAEAYLAAQILTFALLVRPCRVDEKLASRRARSIPLRHR